MDQTRPDLSNSHQQNVHLHMHHVCACQTLYPASTYYTPMNYRTPLISYAATPQAVPRPYLQHYQYTQFNVGSQYNIPMTQISTSGTTYTTASTPTRDRRERGDSLESATETDGVPEPPAEFDFGSVIPPFSELFIMNNSDECQANTDNFIKFLERSCLIAEHIAYRNRNRPCFRNIQNLCIRTRSEILKPRTTISNIHSQGIPWATKDFIYAFVRLTNCWHILKGYWENREGSALGKIEKELSPGFKACYVRWERETIELATELTKIFYNLDVNQSNPGPSVNIGHTISNSSISSQVSLLKICPNDQQQSGTTNATTPTTITASTTTVVGGTGIIISNNNTNTINNNMCSNNLNKKKVELNETSQGLTNLASGIVSSSSMAVHQQQQQQPQIHSGLTITTTVNTNNLNNNSGNTNNIVLNSNINTNSTTNTTNSNNSMTNNLSNASVNNSTSTSNNTINTNNTKNVRGILHLPAVVSTETVDQGNQTCSGDFCTKSDDNDSDEENSVVYMKPGSYRVPKKYKNKEIITSLTKSSSPRVIEFLETAQNVTKGLEAANDKYWVKVKSSTVKKIEQPKIELEDPVNNELNSDVFFSVYEWLSNSNFSDYAERSSTTSTSPSKPTVFFPDLIDNNRDEVSSNLESDSLVGGSGGCKSSITLLQRKMQQKQFSSKNNNSNNNNHNNNNNTNNNNNNGCVDQITSRTYRRKPETLNMLVYEMKNGGLTKRSKNIFDKIIAELKASDLVGLLAEFSLDAPNLDIIQKNLNRDNYRYVNEVVRDLRLIVNNASQHFKKCEMNDEKVKVFSKKLETFLAEYYPNFDFSAINGNRGEKVGKLKIKHIICDGDGDDLKN